MKVKEIMTQEPVAVGPQATLGEIATLMAQQDCGSIPVVREGRLVGIVTDRDIVVRGIAAGRDARTTTAADVMSADPVTIAPDADVREAQRVMSDRQIRRLPVVEDGRLAGLVVLGQIARRESDEERTGEALKVISQPSNGRGSHARG